MTSSPDVVPVFRSFLVPRLLKKEDRRLSVGVVPVPGVVGEVVASGLSVAVVSVAGSVTGLSSRGADGDTVEGSSFAGTAGEVSATPGAVASLLPKKPPKREARLFGLGADSLVVDVGIVSAAVDSPVAVPVPAVDGMLLLPVVFPSAGTIGSPTTRAAVNVSRKIVAKSKRTYQQRAH